MNCRGIRGATSVEVNEAGVLIAATRELLERIVAANGLSVEDVARSLPRCIRVLVHWNTDLPPERIRHVYLGRARALRPDWAREGET
jgi:chorismate mutase